MTTAKMMKKRSVFGVGVLALLSTVAVSPAADAAPIEGAQNAPAPLQYPGQTAAGGGEGSLPVSLLRTAIEAAGNAQLCRLLMTDAKVPIPEPFDFTKCPAQFASKVNNRQGKAHWASASAKPTACGWNCVSKPSNFSDQNLDRPNMNYAYVSGHLDIEVDAPGPNRTVYFNWKAYARCQMSPGGPPHQGEVKFDVAVDPPVVGDAGYFEGAINFFLGPVDWSNRISNAIKAQLSTPSGQSTNTGLKCMSIGASPSTNPAQDAFIFDVTPPRLIAATAGRSATIHLISMTRKSTFNYSPPADPGSFTVFVNGVGSGLPALPGPLPPTGGTVALNMCKKVNMDGADRLQVIVANTLGGTTWSQFGSADNYGAGKTHVMTTGRNVVVPGTPFPGNPHPKPMTIRLNEFEVTYTVEYSNGLGNLNQNAQLAQAQPVAPPPATPVTPGGFSVKGQNVSGAVKNLGLQQQPSPVTPCRPF